MIAFIHIENWNTDNTYLPAGKVKRIFTDQGSKAGTFYVTIKNIRAYPSNLACRQAGPRHPCSKKTFPVHDSSFIKDELHTLLLPTW